MKILIVTLAFAAALAHAQETTTTTTTATPTASEVTAPPPTTSDGSTSMTTDEAKNKGDVSKFKKAIGDKHFDEDKKINDLELRSYAGSLNRYSLQFTASYGGPAINDLSNAHRPNPNHSNGDDRTFLSGSSSFRYRTSQHTGLNFGTGYSLYAPVQAVEGEEVDRKAGTKNYDFHDPTVSFDGTYAVGQTQFRSSVRASAVTTKNYKDGGEWGAAGYSQYAKWTPYHGRVILGVQLAMDYYAYDREYYVKDPTASKKNDPQHFYGDGRAIDYYLNLIPSVEYKITDSLNFNTSLGYAQQHLRQVSNWAYWDHPLSTWRVGFGWAITHDIYVNPYVNFFAESPSMDTTTASLNSTFSIF